MDMCVDLVLNSKTLRNTERKAEVTKIEKVEVEVEDEVKVVTREAYDKSLESFLVAVDTLHSTLFRKGKEVECGGMNKYLRLSPLSSSSSSSSPTCERFDAEDKQEEVEKEKEKEVVASQQGMISPIWLRAVSMAVRTVVSWCTLLLASNQTSLPLYAEEAVEKARERLKDFIRASASYLICTCHPSIYPSSCSFHTNHIVYLVIFLLNFLFTSFFPSLVSFLPSSLHFLP